MNLLKQVFKLSIFFAVVLFSGNLLTSEVQAQSRSYVYESIDVDIEVNADSTMLVTEKMTYRFNGIYRAVERGITLEDQDNIDACKSDPNLQCGGFEFLQIRSVKGQGGLLKAASEEEISQNNDGRSIAPPEFYIASTEQVAGEKRLNITWVFSENGVNFNNETLTFEIQYLVFGGIGYFEDYDLFYWNTVFSDREVMAENVNVRIISPGPVDTAPDNLWIPGRGNNYTISKIEEGRIINIKTSNLLPYQEFTILLRYPKSMIAKYATLNLEMFPSVQNIKIGEDILLTGIEERLAGLPPGEHILEFSAKDRISEVVQVTLAEGEERSLTVDLSLTPLAIFKVIAAIILNIAGICLVPIGLILVYRQWKMRGRDKIESKVIVPEYGIPDGIKPFALGTLKDEHVDMVDITATLIDLAYRGYIKIREYGSTEVLGIKIKQPDFELTKLKPFDGLTKPELKIMDGVFGSTERATTQEMRNKFYTKILGIKQEIYDFLVTEKYFEENPDKVRSRHSIYGLTLSLLGGFGVFSSFLIYPVFVGGGIGLLVTGIALMISSKHMPSKTELGSKLFHKVLGFKMYIETAEKYRVQKLTPDTFEKFLPYAMVFGVEKQWAEKFKDIYKGSPSWFESDSTDVFTTAYMINALGRFNTTTASAMTVSPSSSGSSASGGGWSGGGGFSGGFSGGGGGGGGGGAW